MISLDAFQQIINCQFSGDWLIIQPFGSSFDTGLSSFSVRVSFPNLEGGTPGFAFDYSDPLNGSAGTIRMSGGPAVRVVSPIANPIITAKDLLNHLVTDAGRQVRGFGWSQLGQINNFAQGNWYINLASVPGGTLNINNDNLGESTAYSTSYFTFKRGDVKAGPPPSGFPVDQITCPPAVGVSFSLNTRTLKFTHPF